MKRIILIVALALAVAGLNMAQGSAGNFRHHGMATQQMEAEGMSAAHPTIPIGSMARVHNLENDLITDVMITQRIPATFDRIIDLAPASASALAISRGGTGLVMVTPISTHHPEPSPPELVVEMEDAQTPPVQVYHITINNYITNTPDAEQKAVTELQRSEAITLTNPVQVTVPAAASQTPRGVTISIPQATAAPVTVAPQLPPAAPAPAPVSAAAAPSELPPPVSNVRIIPGLPNPGNNRIYRLMVGTFFDSFRASSLVNQLQNAGFEAVQENVDGEYRVFAVRIHASNVENAASRLGAMGFRQVWLYDE